MPPPVAYQLRVDLKGSRPPIWRRILVSASMTLDRLHDAIQVVMGWEDCHLHMFVKGRQRYSIPSPQDLDRRLPGMPRELDERKHRVSQLLKRENDRIIYNYDFGDSWEHIVTLQKILPYDPAVRMPACIGGKRRCPPEDSGGVWGYYEQLEILKDPGHWDHAHTKGWMGEDFDPEVFSVQTVDQVLGGIRW